VQYPVQCCFCGEVVTLVAIQIYCGNYPCPKCQEGLLIVPETKLTPRDPDPFSVQEFDTLEYQES